MELIKVTEAKYIEANKIEFTFNDGKKKVIDLNKDLEPSSYPKTYYPSQKIKYFLEVESGFIEKYNTKLGDQLNLY